MSKASQTGDLNASEIREAIERVSSREQTDPETQEIMHGLVDAGWVPGDGLENVPDSGWGWWVRSIMSDKEDYASTLAAIGHAEAAIASGEIEPSPLSRLRLDLRHMAARYACTHDLRDALGRSRRLMQAVILAEPPFRKACCVVAAYAQHTLGRDPTQERGRGARAVLLGDWCFRGCHGPWEGPAARSSDSQEGGSRHGSDGVRPTTVMSHAIQAFIYSGNAGPGVLEGVDAARPVRTMEGLTVYPLTIEFKEELYSRESQGLFVHDQADVSKHFTCLSPAGVALAMEMSLEGATACVETDFFGGTGSQSAVAWHLGLIIVGPLEHATWDDAAASAVRGLGVPRGHHQDEFEAAGLGRVRSNEGWFR